MNDPSKVADVAVKIHASKLLTVGSLEWQTMSSIKVLRTRAIRCCRNFTPIKWTPWALQVAAKHGRIHLWAIGSFFEVLRLKHWGEWTHCKPYKWNQCTILIEKMHKALNIHAYLILSDRIHWYFGTISRSNSTLSSPVWTSQCRRRNSHVRQSLVQTGVGASRPHYPHSYLAKIAQQSRLLLACPTLLCW